MPSGQMPSGEMEARDRASDEQGTTEVPMREMPYVPDGPESLGETGASGLSSQKWSLWELRQGSTAIYAPAATAWGENRIDLFAIGINSQIYHQWWDGKQWSEWESLEGTYSISAPATVSVGKNRLDVFWIGIDKQVYRRSWNSNQWSQRESLGGVAIHGVAATSWGPDRIDLFAVGTDSSLYHKYWNGSTWSAWKIMKFQGHEAVEKSSTCISAPAAVSWGANRIDVFALGIDNYVYHAWGNGSSEWRGWEKLGGPCIHGVAVASRGANSLDLFSISTDTIGTDNHMYHRSWNGSSWSRWENLGGACISAPAAVSWGENRLDAFVIGTRSALYQKSWTEESEALGVQASEGEKKNAIAALTTIQSNHFTKVPQSYKVRAEALINDPAQLNQGSYGICGMAAIVYFLLHYDLDKFITLLKSIFDGEDFNSIKVGMKQIDGKDSDYSVLLYGREQKQIERKKKAEGKFYNPQLDFDFIISRSLGKLLKINNKPLYEQQKRFAEDFDLLFNIKVTDNKIQLFDIEYDNQSEFLSVVNMLNNKNGKKLSEKIANPQEEIIRDNFWKSIYEKQMEIIWNAGFGYLENGEITVINDFTDWKLKYPNEQTTDRYIYSEKIITITDTSDSQSSKSKLTVLIDLNKPNNYLLRSDGDLPLNLDAILALMKDVVKVKNVSQSKEIDSVNLIFQEQKPFVIAAVNGAVEWLKAKDYSSKRKFDNPPWEPKPSLIRPKPPLFVHYIAVTGKIEEVQGYYKVPVWTWANEFTVFIKKEHISKYIYGYIYGEL
ncbi:MAG TPA: hypothetical protein V6C85_07770 [Allocoleopsis sp.]